jgi:hypothetical protein
MAFATQKSAPTWWSSTARSRVKSMEDQLAAASTGMKAMGVSFKEFMEPEQTAPAKQRIRR